MKPFVCDASIGLVGLWLAVGCAPGAPPQEASTAVATADAAGPGVDANPPSSDAATDAAAGSDIATPAGDAVDIVTGADVGSTAYCACGDGVCSASCGESASTCPTDCHGCGDGVCAPGEGPKNCPEDCCGGCGDGKCVSYGCGESPTNCPKDCGTACGNKSCDKGENPDNCAADCKTQVCGNGVCEPEDLGPEHCPQDCGTACGDCQCDKGESFSTCPVDCGYCGDGVCSLCDKLGESTTTCPADCQAGGCGQGCDDKIACTVDACASNGGCAHIADQAACDDQNACTTDTCQATGCSHSPSAAGCDDGNPCTVLDQCSGGACQAGATKPCDDGNACTLDTCAAPQGCAHQPIAPGSACGPGGWCSSSGACLTTPAGMTLVPGGTFWMGCNPSKDKACKADESPQHPVSLGPFFIGSTEVTTLDWANCVAAQVCPSPACPGAAGQSLNWDTSAQQPKPGRELHPMNCVTREQAQTYCGWLGQGVQLPTEAQWEYAARGNCEKNQSKASDPACPTAMRTYPWGEADNAGCSYAIVKGFQSDCLQGNTQPVGSKKAGVSPFGLLDMAGNVEEWVLDGYTAYASAAVSNPLGPAGSTGVLRGGSFGSFLKEGAFRASARAATTADKPLPTAGFRCAAPLP